MLQPHVGLRISQQRWEDSPQHHPAVYGQDGGRVVVDMVAAERWEIGQAALQSGKRFFHISMVTYILMEGGTRSKRLNSQTAKG